MICSGRSRLAPRRSVAPAISRSNARAASGSRNSSTYFMGFFLSGPTRAPAGRRPAGCARGPTARGRSPHASPGCGGCCRCPRAGSDRRSPSAPSRRHRHQPAPACWLAVRARPRDRAAHCASCRWWTRPAPCRRPSPDPASGARTPRRSRRRCRRRSAWPCPAPGCAPAARGARRSRDAGTRRRHARRRSWSRRCPWCTGARRDERPRPLAGPHAAHRCRGPRRIASSQPRCLATWRPSLRAAPLRGAVRRVRRAPRRPWSPREAPDGGTGRRVPPCPSMRSHHSPRLVALEFGLRVAEFLEQLQRQHRLALVDAVHREAHVDQHPGADALLEWLAFAHDAGDVDLALDAEHIHQSELGFGARDGLDTARDA
mmetsp:Transcript_4958/g.17985  ORF Transcript_4958/g.17985 Transcript_4958/m.17985 type:complete len:373 (-) Transcript_4958:3363-4481(-)